MEKQFFIKTPKGALFNKVFDAKTRVYLYICDYKVCYASLQRISQDLNLSIDSVIRSLKALEKSKLIEIKKHKTKGKNPYNIYKALDICSTINEPISANEIKKGYKKTNRAPKTSQKGQFKREKPVPEWYYAYEKKDFNEKSNELDVELSEAAKKLFNHGSDLK